MTIVTKRITFDAAHILTNHAGLCKNLHGHTYHVDISLADTAADAERSDMVMDFKEIKQLATRLITDRFDHAFIYRRVRNRSARRIARDAHGAFAVPFYRGEPGEALLRRTEGAHSRACRGEGVGNTG